MYNWIGFRELGIGACGGGARERVGSIPQNRQMRVIPQNRQMRVIPQKTAIWVDSSENRQMRIDSSENRRMHKHLQ